MLQWLDELDDLFASMFLLWDRIRRLVLGAGVLLAILVHLGPVLMPAAGISAWLFAQASLACVAAWACGGIAVSLTEAKRVRET